MTEFVLSNNVPFHDFFELFRSYKPSDLWVSLRNTHWNRKATSLAATDLSQFLITNNYLTITDSQ